jgi:hypothetical protein
MKIVGPDRKFDIKDNQLGIKLIPMISTWDQVDPIFPVMVSKVATGAVWGMFKRLKP